MNAGHQYRVDIATDDDVSAMAALLVELFSIETDFVISLDKHIAGLRMLLGREGATVLVAKDADGRVVGMATCQEVISTACGGISGLVEDVVVQSTYRRCGVGSMLMDAIERLAREKRYVRVQLAADLRNIPALSFYAGIGYTRTNMGLLKKHL